MLATLRQALADTISDQVSNLRVVPAPPKAVDMPTNGDLFAYVQPDDPYVETWQSFSNGGRGLVRFQVVILCPDDANPDRPWERLDDAIDPLSGADNVFAAIRSTPALGIDPSEFEAQATPLLDAVQAPRRVAEADGQVIYYELILPVQVMVQRS